MRWNVGMKIGIGFGLAVLIFLLVSAVSYRTSDELIEAVERRRQTYELLAEVEGVRTAMLDIQVGERGYAITGEDRYLEPYRAALARIDRHLDAIRSRTNPGAPHRPQVEALGPVVRSFLASAEETVAAVRTKGTQSGAEIIRSGREMAHMDEVRAALIAIEKEEHAFLQQRVAEAGASAARLRWIIPGGTALALVIAGLAGIFTTRNIARRLAALTAVAQRITLGDLNVTVPPDPSVDEVGVLARAFDRMVHSLRDVATTAGHISEGNLRMTVTPASPDDTLGIAFARMVENLRDQTRQLMDGANVLGASASQIMASTSQLASTASQSAAAVGETTTTVEEVRQTAQVATQKAQFVFDSAQKAALVSREGRKSAADVAEGMDRIRQQMEAIAASMLRLSEQTQTIAHIIATVEDLAAQSNLLAVNAAIEAAKAGEHGKGFGVVAQEVRSLAAQSRQATTEVRTILNEIQKATTAAVLATEQGSKAVDAGLRQSATAAESIQALADSVTDAAQAATQIAASSQQQLVGVDQVAAAMESIKQATGQNVIGARQLEGAARSLNDLGLSLKNIVARYQV